MRVRMRVAISGTRDGESWPGRGGVVDLPDEEAKHMIAGGLAAEDDGTDEGGSEEHATVPGSPEKATGRKPAAKPAAQK